MTQRSWIITGVSSGFGRHLSEGKPDTSPQGYPDVFFTRSSTSRQAGQETLQRMYARTEDRDNATTWATRQAQYDAVCARGIPDHSMLQRLSCLDMPVFVTNGDSDPMTLPHYSYLLAGMIPQAQVKIYRLRPWVPVSAPRRVLG